MEMQHTLQNTQSCLLEVSYYQDGVVKGFLTDSQSAVKTSFCGLIELILLIDHLPALQESAPQPKPFSQIEKDCLAAFQITIYFHQHSSWQGTVRWVEKNEERCFRSTLELIFLLDTALRGEALPASPTTHSGGQEPANPGKKGINCFE